MAAPLAPRPNPPANGWVDRIVRAESRPARVVLRLLVLVWLAFLAFPISDILTGRWAPAKAVVAWAALAGFTALYVRVMWQRFDRSWRQPHGSLAYYAAMMAVTVACVVGFRGNFGGLVIYAGVATGWRLPPRAAIAGLAILAAFTLAELALGQDGGTVAFYAFMAASLGVSMLLMRGMIRLMLELSEAREERSRLAVAEERLRFSRDLHDVLGHSLSVIALKSQVARRLMRGDPAAAETALGELESVTHASLTTVRGMVTGYRQPSLTDELETAREVLGAAGIEVEVGSAWPDLSQQTDSLLAWMVREGVTNVLRHSRARSCRISIAPEGDGVRLEMSDDGVGLAGSESLDGRQGSGLRGLRERMAAGGGTLDVGPSQAGGFRLAAHLPAA